MQEDSLAAVRNGDIPPELKAKLEADRVFVSEYLSAAMRRAHEPDGLPATLAALRHVADAAGGIGAIARAGGGSRPSIYGALSPGGNPTLKTLLALLGTMGLRLAVEVDDGAIPQVRRMTRGRYAASRKHAPASIAVDDL